MIIELKLTFKDTQFSEEEDPLELVQTLGAPSDFEITGGQIFVERVGGGELDRFSFRIDRDEDGKAKLTILEDVRG